MGWVYGVEFLRLSQKAQARSLATAVLSAVAGSIFDDLCDGYGAAAPDHEQHGDCPRFQRDTQGGDGGGDVNHQHRGI